MASSPSLTTLIILLGFASAFRCLDPLESICTGKIQATQSPVARLAADAFLPAVLATFGLTLLLLVDHVRALGRANAAGGRAPSRLAKATLAVTVATTLLAGTVLRLVGGADDVGWLDTQ
ncbi:unnamed protein product [Urochloa humidicola]